MIVYFPIIIWTVTALSFYNFSPWVILVWLYKISQMNFCVGNLVLLCEGFFQFWHNNPKLDRHSNSWSCYSLLCSFTYYVLKYSLWPLLLYRTSLGLGIISCKNPKYFVTEVKDQCILIHCRIIQYHIFFLSFSCPHSPIIFVFMSFFIWSPPVGTPFQFFAL